VIVEIEVAAINPQRLLNTLIDTIPVQPQIPPNVALEQALPVSSYEFCHLFDRDSANEHTAEVHVLDQRPTRQLQSISDRFGGLKNLDQRFVIDVLPSDLIAESGQAD